MDVSRLLVGLTVWVAVVLTAEAHLGPEQHPTVQELEETAADLSGAIGAVERRLGERIDGLDLAVSNPDRQGVVEAVERAVDEATTTLSRSTDGLNERVDTIAVIGAALVAALAGMSAFLGLRLRAMRKTLARLVEYSGGDEEAGGVEPTDIGRQRREDEERSRVRRVVTHTRKGRISAGMRPTIRELHHPGQAWSPRSVEDAVADIEERGIQYVALGPLGNEAEMEVRRRLGKPYLSTKPDEHGGNNLSELPDPD